MIDLSMKRLTGISERQGKGKGITPSLFLLSFASPAFFFIVAANPTTHIEFQSQLRWYF